MSKILVVDDQKCIRDLLANILCHDGYRVATALDSNSSLLSLQNFQPDLILLDLYLDGAEGFGLLQDFKRIAPDVPVIIFTAYDSYREDLRLAQAEAYVIKSHKFDELKKTIEKVLSPNPKRDSARKARYGIGAWFADGAVETR